MARILIIDDDPKICLFFETLLHKMGHTTVTANRIDEGKKLSQTNSFDLVLLDLELPDGNGLDIMPDLVAAPSSSEVIIITGTGDVRGAEIAFKYDAWGLCAETLPNGCRGITHKKSAGISEGKVSEASAGPPGADRHPW